MTKLKAATVAVHTQPADKEPNAGVTPVYQTSTFLPSDEMYSAMIENRPRDELIYTRYDNPTVRAVEKKLAALEGAEDSLVFSSGMGAISTVLKTFLRSGDRLVCGRDLYGQSHTLISEILPEYGIQVDMVPTENNDAWREALSSPANLVYCEAITNPQLKVADLRSIADAAKSAGAICAVDATFATPVNVQPISLGFDLSIHSGSKYLGGHSDLICGAVSGSKSLIDDLWKRRTLGGTNLDPHAAYLMDRGMKTLYVRVERQNQNAHQVAEFLVNHSSVKWVSYPGLESHPQHSIAVDQFSGFGGMVAFALESDDTVSLAFMRRLQVITETTSLGGVDSVISMPFNTSHARMSNEQREEIGIPSGACRLSCGIEHIDDLIHDLEQSLS